MNQQAEIFPDERRCLACRVMFQPKRDCHKFCCSQCRSAYHAEQQAIGISATVRSARPLKHGGYSVTVYIENDPGLRPGDEIKVIR